jgi:hypothetical protein
VLINTFNIYIYIYFTGANQKTPDNAFLTKYKDSEEKILDAKKVQDEWDLHTACIEVQ